MPVADPTFEFENELHAGGARFVIGCDEVGRGAIAGPVAVGLCVVDRAVGADVCGAQASRRVRSSGKATRRDSRCKGSSSYLLIRIA